MSSSSFVPAQTWRHSIFPTKKFFRERRRLHLASVSLPETWSSWQAKHTALMLARLSRVTKVWWKPLCQDVVCLFSLVLVAATENRLGTSTQPRGGKGGMDCQKMQCLHHSVCVLSLCLSVLWLFVLSIHFQLHPRSCFSCDIHFMLEVSLEETRAELTFAWQFV